MPKVSIITPTHNRAHFISEAIESVLAQTMNDWEQIIIDDGSTDNTREVVEKYANRDSRIRYVYQVKGRLSRHRAMAVHIAQGKFITFLDDDDTFLPHKLERQVSFLEQHPDVGLVYSQVDMVEADKKFIKTWPDVPATSFIELMKDCTIQPNAALVRKECIEQVGNFNTKLKSCDDYDLWLRIARRYPIAFVPETVGIYRWHGRNISHQHQLRLKSHVAIFKAILKQDLSDLERQQAVQRVLSFAYWPAQHALEKGNFGEAMYFFWAALQFSPRIGLMVPWSRFSNWFYRLLKPYLALIYCCCMTPFQRKEVHG